MFKEGLGKLISISALVAVAILFLLPAFYKGGHLLHLLIMVMLNSGLSLALYFTWKTGHVSLGQAGFMGVGAYTSALVTKLFGLNVWAGLFLGGLTAATIGFMIGWLVFRLRGAYFLMATFAFGEILISIWMYFTYPFGGPSGILGIPKPSLTIPCLVKINFAPLANYYYLVLIFAVISAFVMHRLGASSRFGETSECIAETEILAESLGIPTLRHRVVVFTITSFLTGIGGALLGHYLAVITPSAFGFSQSVNLQIYCMVGGRATIMGPIFGATLLTIAGDYLFPLGGWKDVIFGLILLLIIRFMPSGLETVPQRIWALIQRRS